MTPERLAELHAWVTGEGRIGSSALIPAEALEVLAEVERLQFALSTAEAQLSALTAAARKVLAHPVVGMSPHACIVDLRILLAQQRGGE